MRNIRHWLMAVFLAGLLAGGPIGSIGSEAQESQPKRLAIVIKNDATASSPHAYRAQQGSRAVAARLRDLGYAFLQLQDADKCVANDRAAVELEVGQAEAALACVESVTKSAEIVVLYFAGPVAAVGKSNFLLPASGETAAEPKEPRLAIPDLLQSVASKSSFVSVVIVDGLEPASAEPEVRARHRFLRAETPGKRRILAYSAPAGEVAEPGSRSTSAYTDRLLAMLDAEVANSRRGNPLRDVRELLTHRFLVSSKAWGGRTSEVLIEGLGTERITLAGRVADVKAEVSEGDGAIGKPFDCGVTYGQVVRGVNCKRLFDFQKRCGQHFHAAVATTALRLRCADELVEQKQKAMQEAFAAAEQRKSCAVMTAFLEKYGLDFDLADTPELEKATGLQTKHCQEEARQKEIAALETELRSALGENDCAAFKKFEAQSGLKLAPDQLTRLTSAMKQRCETEEKAHSTLKTCLEQGEAGGNFCGAANCIKGFKEVLPKESYFAQYRTESQRQEKICKEYGTMQSCFSADECGGERCSLPLRLAVANGPLISRIQTHEADANRKCSAKRERERLAMLEVERERQRRQDEMRAEARRAATFRLTLCNLSSNNPIWIAIYYWDYDDSNPIVEGWWNVPRGECSYVGDRFKRGWIKFYAHSSGERYVWRGDFGLCVAWNRFRRINTAGISCPTSRHRLFRQVEVTDREYTRNFTD